MNIPVSTVSGLLVRAFLRALGPLTCESGREGGRAPHDVGWQEQLAAMLLALYGWAELGARSLVTLGLLIDDYVPHMRHHLDYILRRSPATKHSRAPGPVA